MVSKKQLEKLKVIMKNNYNLDLTDDEIYHLGNSLVDYFTVALKVYRENYDEFQKLKQEKIQTQIDKFRKRLNLENSNYNQTKL